MSSRDTDTLDTVEGTNPLDHLAQDHDVRAYWRVVMVGYLAADPDNDGTRRIDVFDSTTTDPTGEVEEITCWTCDDGRELDLADTDGRPYI